MSLPTMAQHAPIPTYGDDMHYGAPGLGLGPIHSTPSPEHAHAHSHPRAHAPPQLAHLQQQQQIQQVQLQQQQQIQQQQLQRQQQQQQAGHAPHHPAHPPVHPSLQQHQSAQHTPIAHSPSPTDFDFVSPATTSYLPTPPQAITPAAGGPVVVPPYPSAISYSHAQAAGLFPEWNGSPASSISRHTSVVASPSYQPGIASSGHAPQQQDGRTSDVVMGRRASDNGAVPGRVDAPHPVPIQDDGRVGVDDPCSERSYSELKVLGDGSFGTVWLCDWHSPVKSGILLSAMQCGAGARPEWAGKRLVALKRMKRVWEGGWRQARNLGELVSLRTIPAHPAVIPLYDAFISPRSRELYFVFECMEGNLYQLTKSRKGRPLAAGLIASCFHQIVTGLFHIHQHGYFHRDMKPENLLVTTTGLCDYLSTPALNHLNKQRAAGHPEDVPMPSLNPEAFEKDVQVIVKLADFGLARAIDSKPPYTEYVSTRWYRAPEVLLRSTEYGAPVDMWALGTILAEMINLKPLFPGISEIDQVFRICQTLGDPSPDYGVDERGRPFGGGRWNSGVKLAKNVGFSFPKAKPVNLRNLFPEETPRSLVECIEDLLRYNPKYRMTSAQCMDHPYFHETRTHLQRMPALPRIAFSEGQPLPQSRPNPVPVDLNVQPRQMPPSHSHQERHPPVPAADMRALPVPHEQRAHVPNGHPVAPQNLQQPLPPQQLQPLPLQPQPQPQQQQQQQQQQQRQQQQQPHQPQQPQQRVYLNQPPALFRRDSSEPRSAYGTSALVHQLRELDLPTEDLASYGQRRWAEEQASRRASEAALSSYDNNTPGSATNSNQSLSNLNSALSQTNIQQQYPVPSNAAVSQSSVHRVDRHSPNPMVAAYVQQQGAQLYQQQPMPMQLPPERQQHQQQLQPQVSSASIPSVHSNRSVPAAPAAQSVSKLAPTGKKKKWGLSSVFGGNGKHDSSPQVPEYEQSGYSGSSSSLKRTQSGHHPAERAMAPMQPVQAPPADPKKAKKEAEKQARELAKAKREAAERAQQERARAVLAKRGQIASGGEEWESAGVGIPSTTARDRSDLLSGVGAASVQSLASARSASQHSIYGHGGGKAYEDDIGRNKARKHTEDDDHSSIGRGSSIKSRSALTLDSDGSRRGSQPWLDPLVQSNSRRGGMPSSYRHPTHMSHGSSASLESQLASQLQRQATVASASESSLSLGRRTGVAVASQLSLDGSMDVGQGSHKVRAGDSTGQLGAPSYASSYASSHGGSIKRSANGRKSVLPSIGDYGEGHYEQINPMFRVPAQTTHTQSEEVLTTLPPFATIASMAGSHGVLPSQQTQHHHHPHHQQQQR